MPVDAVWNRSGSDSTGHVVRRRASTAANQSQNMLGLDEWVLAARGRTKLEAQQESGIRNNYIIDTADAHSRSRIRPEPWE